VTPHSVVSSGPCGSTGPNASSSLVPGRGEMLYPDSDYDVIVIRATDRDFTQRLRDVVPYILRAGVRMDVIVYTPEEWEVVQAGPFGETVLREGRVLYEASRNAGRGSTVA